MVGKGRISAGIVQRNCDRPNFFEENRKSAFTDCDTKISARGVGEKHQPLVLASPGRVVAIQVLTTRLNIMPTVSSSRQEIAARVRAEGLITLEQAARLIPVRNAKGHVAPGTLLRWIVSGKSKVKLDACRQNGEWFTSLAALSRFRSATGA